MNKSLPIIALSFIAFSTLAAPLKPDTNELLYHYCHVGHSEFERTITVGQSRKVMYHQGPFMQVSAHNENQVIEGLMREKIAEVSDNGDCAQYLISRSVWVDEHLEHDMVARMTFDFDDDELNKQSRYLLLKLAARLEQQVPELNVMGNTDSKGSHDYNFSLGLKRSTSVINYLKDHGVHIEKSRTQSQGENEPVQSNESVSGRQQNRRVDIYS
ncbi:OmpA family protein [uncultured Vibrio sp.]|uniref:OmpA family protein n=1 Tax=uncultured Vibrio sp. TaxID=114054 RepID=UPI00091FF795|nr:OmpA family protein [uncultured Vibrio sp.]OIQ25096.1 MAG: hypothetical protein BM561_07365 [Vibrio sp. MedPE-SWchi]